MEIPGDPTPEQQEQAFRRLHERAVEQWGMERAGTLEQSLRETSLAILRLESVRYFRDDAPGFYLHEMSQGRDS